MKIVILAAGMGTRLGSDFLLPKTLIPIKKDKTILDFQLENIKKFVDINNIFIVVGYKKEMIMERYPDLIFIYNNAYAKTNTSKSLLRALLKIRNEDVIWLNGDVFFEKEILSFLMNSRYSACLVDQKNCGEEEVKYNTNKDGFIKEISKKVSNPLGEAVGINLIKKNDLKKFINALKSVDDSDYFERALEILTVSGRIKVKPISIKNYFCQEIDFVEDLLNVKKYLSSQNKK